MKIITLMEDKAASGEFVAERGLCQYIETAKHKILFDMGPSGSFVKNAETLGVDLGEVDIAVLSHGHSDHGGGLETFCFVNHMADVFVNPEAFGDFYAVLPGQEPRYIGLSNQLWRVENRMVPSVPGLTLGGELTFLGDIPNTFEWTPVVPKLQQKTDSGFVRDEFRHEQHLLVSSQGKTVLFAGCAHGGIVNIELESKISRRVTDAKTLFCKVERFCDVLFAHKGDIRAVSSVRSYDQNRRRHGIRARI